MHQSESMAVAGLRVATARLSVTEFKPAKLTRRTTAADVATATAVATAAGAAPTATEQIAEDISVGGGGDDLEDFETSEEEEALPTKAAWTPEQRRDLEAINRRLTRVEKLQSQDSEQLAKNKIRIGPRGFATPVAFHQALDICVVSVPMERKGNVVCS